MNSLTNHYNGFVNGRISFQELRNLLLEHTFHSKKKWKLGWMTEDDFSEFLIYLEGSIKKIVQNYDGSLSNFSTYFSNAVIRQAGWWRIKRFEKNKRLSCGDLLVNEEQSRVSDDIADEIVERLTDTHNKHKLRMTKVDNVVREFLLVLTLKASYDITDTMIEKIACVTDVNEEALRYMVSEARKSMEKKINRLNILNIRRSNAYSLRRNAIDDAELSTEESLFIINKGYSKYDKRWIKINNMISQQSMTPANLVIGDLLDISTRRITKILKYAAGLDCSGSIDALSDVIEQIKLLRKHNNKEEQQDTQE